jgi:hypothetical protein
MPIAWMMNGAVDSSTLSIVALVAAVGTAAMWRILAGMVDHATRLHDTRVKAIQLQIKYLERARAFRESGGMKEGQELVVAEAGDAE